MKLLSILFVSLAVSATVDAQPSRTPPAAPQVAEKTTVFNVEGMDCASCVKHIQKGLAKKSGIQKVIVEIDAKRVTVTYAPDKIDAEKIRKAIEELGYKAKIT